MQAQGWEMPGNVMVELALSLPVRHLWLDTRMYLARGWCDGLYSLDAQEVPEHRGEALQRSQCFLSI